MPRFPEDLRIIRAASSEVRASKSVAKSAKVSSGVRPQGETPAQTAGGADRRPLLARLLEDLGVLFLGASFFSFRRSLQGR